MRSSDCETRRGLCQSRRTSRQHRAILFSGRNAKTFWVLTPAEWLVSGYSVILPWSSQAQHLDLLLQRHLRQRTILRQTLCKVSVLVQSPLRSQYLRESWQPTLLSRDSPSTFHSTHCSFPVPGFHEGQALSLRQLSITYLFSKWTCSCPSTTESCCFAFTSQGQPKVCTTNTEAKCFPCQGRVLSSTFRSPLLKFGVKLQSWVCSRIALRQKMPGQKEAAFPWVRGVSPGNKPGTAWGAINSEFLYLSAFIHLYAPVKIFVSAFIWRTTRKSSWLSLTIPSPRHAILQA